MTISRVSLIALLSIGNMSMFADDRAVQPTVTTATQTEVTSAKPAVKLGDKLKAAALGGLTGLVMANILVYNLAANQWKWCDLGSRFLFASTCLLSLLLTPKLMDMKFKSWLDNDELKKVYSEASFVACVAMCSVAWSKYCYAKAMQASLIPG